MNERSSINSEAVEELIAGVADDYCGRLDNGENPDIEQYAERHPQEAGVIRRTLNALHTVRAMDPISAVLGGQESDDRAATAARKLGDYRIVAEIGRGGMGVVYEAEQISLGRRVALKVLPFASVLDQRQIQRFHNEAHAAASLHHNNIVPVYGTGCERGVHYYAMQYIEGESLAEVIHDLQQLESRDEDQGGSGDAKRLERRDHHRSVKFAEPQDANEATSDYTADVHPPGSPQFTSRARLETKREVQAALSTHRSAKSPGRYRNIVELGIQVAEALDHAHGNGVIHRDIKPSNLMLDASGKVWVTDFGLARVESDSGLTVTGDLIGTLRYMSPEQALAKRVVVDERTDIYSLGVTLYELLTLRPVYSGNNRQELLRQIAFEEPRPMRRLRKQVPPEFETMVMKAMAKNPAERYTTAREFVDDLQRFLENKPIQARRPTLAQRAAKWSRRHKPIVASAAAAVATILVVATFAFAAIAAKELENTRAAEKATELEAKLRRKAEFQTERVTGLLAGSYMGRAQALCEQGEIGRGMLWFAHSLRTAPEDATDLERVILANLAAWRPQLHSLRTLVQQNSEVKAVTFSPDGLRILVGCSDETVRLWDAATGRPIGQPLRHPGAAGALTFSPDGSRILTGSDDGAARLWNAATLEPIGEPLRNKPLDGPPDAADAVNIVGFSPDGARMVTGSGSGRLGGAVRLWDAATLTPVGQPLERGKPMAIRFCPEGLLAVVTIANVHQLWDVNRGEPIGPPVKQARTNAAAISPDGLTFATAGHGSMIQLWNAATGKQVLPPIVHGGVVQAVAFSPDGRRLVSTGNTRAARVWDTATGQPVGTPLRQRSTVRAVAYGADGRRILTGSDDGSVRLWDVAPDNSRGQAIQHPDRIVTAAFSPVGLRILTERDGWFQLSDATTGEAAGKAFHYQPKQWPWPFRMSFSPDGSRLLLRPSFSAELRDVATGQLIGQPLPRLDSAIHDVAFSPDGSRIVTGYQRGVAVLRDANTLEQIGAPFQHSVPTPSSGVRVLHCLHCVAFSPDGSRILTGGYDAKTRLWDARTLESIGEPLLHASEVKSQVYSPDGSRMLTGFADGTARLWDLMTLGPVGQPLHHQEIVSGVAFSPDGSRFLSCSLDQTARLWDTATLKPIGPSLVHESWWPDVSFSPDGSQFLVAGWRGTSRLWKTPPGSLEGDRERIVLWAQVITGLELDASGGISGLDGPTWQELHGQLEDRGGQPTASYLPQPMRMPETDFSRSMVLALEGQHFAKRGQWDKADDKFDQAFELSGESRTLRTQIGHWCRELTVGRHLRLSGTTSDGEALDWSLYQGKHLLVLFWNAASAPNDLQMMNVRKNYEQYHGRGLEVLGIITDEGLTTPEQSPPMEPFPGVTLGAGQVEGLGKWTTYLGGGGDFAAMLVDSAGYVVTLDARGLKLDRLLAEALGAPYIPRGRLTYIDLATRANEQLSKALWSESLSRQVASNLPRGEQMFGGVKFKIAEGVIFLRNQWGDAQPEKVEEISVNQEFAKLYVLHGIESDRPNGTLVGQYRLHYEDGTSEILPIVRGQHISKWFTNGGQEAEATARAYLARTEVVDRRMYRYYVTVWENPQPDRQVVSIDMLSVNRGGPVCIAMTVEAAAGPAETELTLTD